MPSKDTQFKAGDPPGPGRPKGSRNKLAENFIRDLFKHWEDNGRAALDAALEASPAQYMRIVASLLPRDINVNVEDPLGHLSDEEVKALLDAARNLAGIDARVGSEGRQEKPRRVH